MTSWLSNLVERLKEAAKAEPVPCPRGWGDLTFHVGIWGVPPLFAIERTCPIGGVAHCVACVHPYNPENIGSLRESLRQLDELRRDQLITESQYELRRHLLVNLEEGLGQSPGQRFHTLAWIFGAIGLVVAATGLVLVSTIHLGFWAVVGLGALLLALCVAFSVLSASQKRGRN